MGRVGSDFLNICWLGLVNSAGLTPKKKLPMDNLHPVSEATGSLQVNINISSRVTTNMSRFVASWLLCIRQLLLHSGLWGKYKLPTGRRKSKRCFNRCGTIGSKSHAVPSPHDLQWIYLIYVLLLIYNYLDLDVCFVGVPFDQGTSNRSGARFGPRQIRQESHLVRAFNKETGTFEFILQSLLFTAIQNWQFYSNFG